MKVQTSKCHTFSSFLLNQLSLCLQCFREFFLFKYKLSNNFYKLRHTFMRGHTRHQTSEKQPSQNCFQLENNNSPSLQDGKYQREIDSASLSSLCHCPSRSVRCIKYIFREKFICRETSAFLVITHKKQLNCLCPPLDKLF